MRRDVPPVGAADRPGDEEIVDVEGIEERAQLRLHADIARSGILELDPAVVQVERVAEGDDMRGGGTRFLRQMGRVGGVLGMIDVGIDVAQQVDGGLMIEGGIAEDLDSVHLERRGRHVPGPRYDREHLVPQLRQLLADHARGAPEPSELLDAEHLDADEANAHYDPLAFWPTAWTERRLSGWQGQIDPLSKR